MGSNLLFLIDSKIDSDRILMTGFRWLMISLSDLEKNWLPATKTISVQGSYLIFWTHATQTRVFEVIIPEMWSCDHKKVPCHVQLENHQTGDDNVSRFHANVSIQPGAPAIKPSSNHQILSPKSCYFAGHFGRMWKYVKHISKPMVPVVQWSTNGGGHMRTCSAQSCAN